MCFTYECDWVARVCEESTSVCPVEFRCDECRRILPAESAMFSVYMQEHCEDEHDEGDGEFSPGMTCEARWCQDCENLRNAICEVELEDGCRLDESIPALFFLAEELHGMGSGAKKYLNRFVELYGERTDDYVKIMFAEGEDE